ncbi:MAG: hypothetical protein ACE5PV_13700 [Candidatus Poribacteria bacterium]
MSALISEPQNPNKPKLLGTLDTDTDIVCHDHISGIYPRCGDQVRSAIGTKHYSRPTVKDT